LKQGLLITKCMLVVSEPNSKRINL